MVFRRKRVRLSHVSIYTKDIGVPIQQSKLRNRNYVKSRLCLAPLIPRTYNILSFDLKYYKIGRSMKYDITAAVRFTIVLNTLNKCFVVIILCAVCMRHKAYYKEAFEQNRLNARRSARVVYFIY